MVSTSEITENVKNQNLLEFLDSLKASAGLDVKFEALIDDERVRARCSYEPCSSAFVVRLRKDWKEMDLAHELMHGKLMFLETYGIPVPIEAPLCRLVRDYVEDASVSERLKKELGITPFDRQYISNLERFSKDMWRGQKYIKNKYWDSFGRDCDKLHKAFLFFQAWHFKTFLDANVGMFLPAFKNRYRSKDELFLASELVRLYKDSAGVGRRENYDKLLESVLRLKGLDFPEGVGIGHYQRREGGGFIIT